MGSDSPPSFTAVRAFEGGEWRCLAQESKTLTRRSTRVRARIPIRITSLDPARPVSLSGETLIVNAHGCAARSPQALEVGTPVRLQVRETEATARVAVCLPLGE